MIHESRRQAGANGSVEHNGSGMTLEHVANLYKSAPGMQGQVENEGLPVGTPALDFTLKVMRDTDGFSERALYVIDDAGIIRYRHLSPELHKIPDIYELFDQLKALNVQAEASLAS
jgi:hypothetical protein